MKTIHIESVQGLGWLPELPDYRDYPLAKAGIVLKPKEALPDKISLRQYMSPVRDQGLIGSCTGFAACAAVEYIQRIDGDRWNTIYSPLFAYFQARIMDGKEWQNIDAGAYIRDAIKAVVNIGVPPESTWKYRPEWFARNPTKTAYKAAERWKAGAYYKCLTVADIITAIANGFPVVGGFSCYTNMFTSQVNRSGIIPMPAGSLEGGHAVCFMGYDRQRGLFEFKNSWGTDWGEQGYGYLPFDFVVQRLASDFWCIKEESRATYLGGKNAPLAA